MRNVITRKEAKDQGLKRYFTGKPCPQGHVVSRFVSGYSCSQCKLEKIKSKKKTDSEYAKRQKKLVVKGSRKWAVCSSSMGAENHRLRNNLRRRLNHSLSGLKSGSAVRDLGCSIEEFRIYIERQFVDGMSWSNYGKWNLDHKIPLASFDLTDREQFLEVVHYTNYQPLWALDNSKKGARLDWAA